MAKKTTEIIEIQPIKLQKVNVRIVGDTPLIMHAWSEKAKAPRKTPGQRLRPRARRAASATPAAGQMIAAGIAP